MKSNAARRAEALGASLPPLLVAAERIATAVVAGDHGRRNAGPGDSFWQFRPFAAGDSASQIDWRQSARSERLFVREREWEAQQNVFLWRDDGPNMTWCGPLAKTTKRERAELLLLALAALLLRGSERVRLIGTEHPSRGRAALEAIAAALAATAGPLDLGFACLPRYARVVLFGDFLAPPEGIAPNLARFAAAPAAGHLVMLLDPAECTLPYAGRVRFVGPKGEAGPLIARVEAVREAYGERIAAQIEAVRDLARSLGWSFTLHVIDQPPVTALLALYHALAPR